MTGIRITDRAYNAPSHIFSHPDFDRRYGNHTRSARIRRFVDYTTGKELRLSLKISMELIGKTFLQKDFPEPFPKNFILEKGTRLGADLKKPKLHIVAEKFRSSLFKGLQGQGTESLVAVRRRRNSPDTNRGSL